MSKSIRTPVDRRAPTDGAATVSDLAPEVLSAAPAIPQHLDGISGPAASRKKTLTFQVAELQLDVARMVTKGEAVAFGLDATRVDVFWRSRLLGKVPNAHLQAVRNIVAADHDSYVSEVAHQAVHVTVEY